MNKENETRKEIESIEQEVGKLRKNEVIKNWERIKNGKAVGLDDTPVKVWKCLEMRAGGMLMKWFNKILDSEIIKEWRKNVLVPIFKSKDNLKSCSNYKGIKQMNHTIIIWKEK